MPHALLNFYRKTNCFLYPSPVRPPKEGTPMRGNKTGSVGGYVIEALATRAGWAISAVVVTTFRCKPHSGDAG